jgi:hypothetical protein
MPDSTLRLIDNNMTWNFMPAKGTVGGILVGFKTLLFDIISWQYVEYCVVAIVNNQSDNFTWR